MTGKVSRSKVKVKVKYANYRNHLAVTPQRIVRFSSSADCSIPILWSDMFSVRRTADFLVIIRPTIVKRTNLRDDYIVKMLTKHFTQNCKRVRDSIKPTEMQAIQRAKST